MAAATQHYVTSGYAEGRTDRTILSTSEAWIYLASNGDLISAFGANLFDDNAKIAKDFDTAMFILKSKSGVLIHINNSRRAVYGYDQRVEVFGSKGMVISNNQTPNSLERYTSSSTSSKDLIHFFFIERYQQAYRDQFNSFVETIKTNSKPKVTFEDGRKALIIANAAYDSFENKKTVDINYD